MNSKLWTRNFTLLIAGTVLGSAGAIAGMFALSILVFDETGSTLATALTVAIEMIPGFLVPLVCSPLMDRLPRKPVLVAGDAVNGILYGLAGIYLLNFEFSYLGFLVFTLIISTLGAFDQLAYISFYPKLIPTDAEEKGYAIFGMVYPIVMVVMTPAAAFLVDTLGIGWILILQCGLSLVSAGLENFIEIKEAPYRKGDGLFSIRQWRDDFKQGMDYLRKHPGFLNIFVYIAFSGGISSGYGPIIVAFFRTAPGFSLAMYSFFNVAEFVGRTLGGLVHYHSKIPAKRRFSIVFFIYQFYEFLGAILMWIPYPAMLINRAVAGFSGMNSFSIRQRAVQTAVPDDMRARINAVRDMLSNAFAFTLTVFVGWLGERVGYRWCVTVCSLMTLALGWLLIWRNRRDVMPIYNREAA